MTWSLHLPTSAATETEKVQQRRELLRQRTGQAFPELEQFRFDPERVGTRNCENLVGSVEIPVGVAGPLMVRGQVEDGESWENEALLPLATTEGALVASVNRGSKVLDQAGGVDVFIRPMGMTRAPVFRCADGKDALALGRWIDEHQSELAKIGEDTSSHLRFKALQWWVRGRHLYLRLAFLTDQAMGMNMVTIASQTVAEWICGEFSGPAELIAISSNVCTDKKDNAINTLFGRGYWVQAEAFLSAAVLQERLHVSAAELAHVHLAKNLVGSNLAGSHSQNMQVANVVAAMYLATGQDPAHVVEASQAATTIELNGDGLYVAVTLPSVNVGVVGGGTGLPAQTQARSLIQEQSVTAAQLAGVIGAAALAAELSGLAALATQSLACAHERLGRGKK